MRKDGSGADVACIEGTGDGGIFGAFQDGAPVGEDGHFVRRHAEAQQEFVVADVRDRWSQAIPERIEIQRTSALVNLDGIASAHGDVRLGIPLEVSKFAPRAHRALRIARYANGLEMAAPDVTREELAMQRALAAGEQLHGFRCFERSNEIDDGVEDAGSVASLLEALRLGLEQARKAS